MIPVEKVAETDPNDEYSIAAFARAAAAYLLRHKWCVRIKQGYLSNAWPGILGVFCFEIEPASADVDESMWVIVGDLPSAHICNDNATGAAALKGYVCEMNRWVRAAYEGRPVDKLIPVNVPPTHEYAAMLESRLQFIRDEILPYYDDDREDDECVDDAAGDGMS